MPLAGSGIEGEPCLTQMKRSCGFSFSVANVPVTFPLVLAVPILAAWLHAGEYWWSVAGDHSARVSAVTSSHSKPPRRLSSDQESSYIIPTHPNLVWHHFMYDLCVRCYPRCRSSIAPEKVRYKVLSATVYYSADTEFSTLFRQLLVNTMQVGAEPSFDANLYHGGAASS